MTAVTISHSQYCALYHAIERCTDGMAEPRARRFTSRLTLQLLEDFRVPPRERFIGRRGLRMPDLAAIRAADFDQAMQILEGLARLPV